MKYSPDPSSQSSPWALIVNPASASGGTGRKWPRHQRLLRRVLPSFEPWFTQGPGAARDLARRAIDLGFQTLAVHGGDGTVNEAVNGLLSHPSLDGIRLVLLPHGTGTDLVRTLGISRSPVEAARQANQARVRSVDLGQVDFLDLQGNPAQRFFVNVTDVGFGGELVRYVNSRSKRLGGRISFLRGLLATLLRYRNKTVRISIDQAPAFEVRTSSIVIANGQYFGGGMWVAPEALPDDGILDLIVIGDVSKREVLTNIGRLYRGTLAEHPKVSVFKARTIQLDADEEVLIDLDGELVGRLPARLQVLPQVLKVLVPASNR